MIAETRNRIRTASVDVRASSAIGTPRGRHSVPAGTHLRFALPQRDTDRTTVRRPAAADASLSSTTLARARGSRKAPAAPRSQGEAMMLSALLACAVVVCALGVIYLAAYMKVASQSRLIHSLQAQVTNETARQHELINEIGQLESPARIAQAAEKMGMVMGEKADYVIIHNTAARRPADSNSDTVAQVPADASGTLGAN